MSRKTLPKAITRTSKDMREIAAVATEQRKRRTTRKISKDLPEKGIATSVSAPRREAAEAARAPAISSPPTAGDLVPATPMHAPQSDTAGRQPQARKIVERHTTYAAVGGLLPLPIANVAAVTAIIVRMVKALSDLYGVPFERDRTRSIVIGLMGGTMPTGLAAATASALALVVPASSLVGLAVSSAAAAACTRGIGLIFAEHFENGTMSPDVTVTEQA